MYKNVFNFSSLNDHVESNAWSSKYQQAFDFVTREPQVIKTKEPCPKTEEREMSNNIFLREEMRTAHGFSGLDYKLATIVILRSYSLWPALLMSSKSIHNASRSMIDESRMMLHIVASRVSRYHHFWTWFMIIIYNCILFIAVAKDVSGNERRIDKINKEKETRWTHHFSIIKYLIFNIVFGYF